MNDVFFLARFYRKLLAGHLYIFFFDFFFFSFRFVSVAIERFFCTSFYFLLGLPITGLSVWLSDQGRFGKMTSVIQYDYGAWWK